jgi:hypothetical protein
MGGKRITQTGNKIYIQHYGRRHFGDQSVDGNKNIFI